MNQIDIKPYTGLFHDGTIEDIRHLGRNIEILMGSAEISDEENKDNIELSKDFCINGILHIEGIKSVTEDDLPFQGTLKMKYENAEIFTFKLKKNKTYFEIIWTTFPPNPPVDDFSVIEIEAEKIWWENIPDLLE